MRHEGRLPVHDTRRPHDPAAVRLADRLVAEANAEGRDLAAPAPDRVDRDPRLGGRARAGREDDRVRPQRADIIDRYLVVATHLDLGTQLPEVLHEVVRERVVVVDDE
jgi:hypothetical protein